MDLKEADLLVNGSLTVRRFDELGKLNGFAHSNTYISRFGSWENAKKFAGVTR